MYPHCLYKNQLLWTWAEICTCIMGNCICKWEVDSLLPNLHTQMYFGEHRYIWCLPLPAPLCPLTEEKIPLKNCYRMEFEIPELPLLQFCLARLKKHEIVFWYADTITDSLLSSHNKLEWYIENTRRVIKSLYLPLPPLLSLLMGFGLQFRRRMYV